MNPPSSDRCDRCGKVFRLGGSIFRYAGVLFIAVFVFAGGFLMYEKMADIVANARAGGKTNVPTISGRARNGHALGETSGKKGNGFIGSIQKYWEARVSAMTAKLFSAKPKPSPRKAPKTIPQYSRQRAGEITDMVFIESGTVLIGAVKPKTPDELPAEMVFLDAFFIDINEVTVSSFSACVEAGACLEIPIGEDCNGGTEEALYSANCVTWENAKAFCVWAGKRLPTEAEWEKAARNGTQTGYFFGETPEDLPDYAWYKGNSGGKLQQTGLKEPSENGLYDIYGNVWEWTGEWYKNDYAAAESPSTDGRTRKVLRGGGAHDAPVQLRSASRRLSLADEASVDYGFRCAADLVE
jgi:formylglycine-generating enzyme required for sulfatase activity